jgi:isocitrate dehydrogenase kinase/phosphatase
MSLMGSNAVVAQLAGSYPEEAVLDQLGWLYEEQIRRVSGEIFALLPGYRQRVDEATYAHEKETFLGLLDRAHEDDLSVPELEAMFKRLIAHRQVFAVTARQGAQHEPPVPVRAPTDPGV